MEKFAGSLIKITIVISVVCLLPFLFQGKAVADVTLYSQSGHYISYFTPGGSQTDDNDGNGVTVIPSPVDGVWEAWYIEPVAGTVWFGCSLNILNGKVIELEHSTLWGGRPIGRWRTQDPNAVLCTVVSEVNVKDFGATGNGTTDDTNAFKDAELALPLNAYGGAVGGGIINIPAGTYLITSWSPALKNLKVVGAGQYNSTIKGSGAGDYTIRLTNQTRGVWENLSIDGGGVKAAALQIGTGDCSGFIFEGVRFLGGTTNTLVIGDTTTGSDISENAFVGCAVALGDNGTGAALKLRGNNTGLISFFGGRVSTGNATAVGAVAVDIDDGAGVAFYQTDILALLSAAPNGYAIIARSGHVKMFGGHVEARGLIHTLSTDPRTDATVSSHMFHGINCATPSGTDTVYHEAPRTLLMINGRLGGNFRIGTAATANVLTNGFASGSGYILEGNAVLTDNNRHLSNTASLDFPNIATKTTAELTISVPGAAAGDACTVMPNGAPEAGLVWSGFAGTNIVTIRLGNITGAGINPAVRTWRVDVWKH